MAGAGGTVPDVRASGGGAVIRLRVKARAGRTGLAGVHAGALRVAVNEAPEKGKANRAVLEVVAKALGLAPSSLRLVSGETSQDKQVWVPLEAGEAAKRLGEAG